MKTAIIPKERPSKAGQWAKLLYRGAGLGVRLLFRKRTYAELPGLTRKAMGLARRKCITGSNNKELARLVKERKRVTFVGSYPRSGNTWMRYLLSDVLLQKQGVETRTELAQPDWLIPDYYNDLITPRAEMGDGAGYLIKTHDTIEVLEERIGNDPGMRRCRYFYLFRTPEDVLVSLYHYSLWEKYILSDASGNLDLFCLEHLPAWIEHLRSYLDAIEDGVSVYLVSYEALLREPTAILDDAVRWLGIPHTAAMIQRAEANMKFSELQAMERKARNGGGRLFRRGVKGSGASELKPETLSQIRAATSELMARANESLGRQRMKEEAEPNANSVPVGSRVGRASDGAESPRVPTVIKQD